mmetsp:Transcript_115871/g.327886  ORF Transcript_115871/g.327886 Transcript_115871/m.327886 type:complete len:254 (+) Transcript_115871:883-1644(+)
MHRALWVMSSHVCGIHSKRPCRLAWQALHVSPRRPTTPSCESANTRMWCRAFTRWLCAPSRCSRTRLSMWRWPRTLISRGVRALGTTSGHSSGNIGGPNSAVASDCPMSSKQQAPIFRALCLAPVVQQASMRCDASCSKSPTSVRGDAQRVEGPLWPSPPSKPERTVENADRSDGAADQLGGTAQLSKSSPSGSGSRAGGGAAQRCGADWPCTTSSCTILCSSAISSSSYNILSSSSNSSISGGFGGLTKRTR